MENEAQSFDQLAELIALVYDAALDESLWAGIADRIAHTLGATSAIVKVHSGECVRLLEMTPNLVVEGHLGEWAEDWHGRDLWVRRSVAFGMSRIVTSDELVTAEEQRRSAFYQEWLKHLDIFHMIGAVFGAGEGAVAVLGVHRPHDAAGFGAHERRLATLLLPHLERAFRISQRLKIDARTCDAAFASLDTIDTGVILVDGRARVRHVNGVATTLLRRNRELTVGDGRLGAASSALQARLALALRDALAPAKDRVAGTPRSIRIERPARPAWSCAVAPLRSRWARSAWDEPLALVLLRDPEYPPYRIEHLRALYGLTRTEALTAAELAGGRTLEEIGAAFGIGIGTVRSHLKQVLQKTGTSRQAEAVAVIARSVAAAPFG